MMKAIASPSVRSLAARKGIDLDSLSRKLNRETLTREDVEADIRNAGGKAEDFWNVDHAAYGPVTVEPVSRIARFAARNLTAAQAMIPAVTHHDEADISSIEAFRATLKQEVAEHGIGLTALAFHVNALSRCLKQFPRFNASLSSDGQRLFLKQYVHIAIAVDTTQGLVVPVIRNADRKGLFAVAEDIADLASRARERKIRSEEIGGASMTITNLGGIGGTAFTPIVNPPEVAILGISRASEQPVWDGTAFRPVLRVPLDLSYDHRVINGVDAARFLSYYAGLLSDPRRLLL